MVTKKLIPDLMPAQALADSPMSLVAPVVLLVATVLLTVTVVKNFEVVMTVFWHTCTELNKSESCAWRLFARLDVHAKECTLNSNCGTQGDDEGE